MSTERHDAVVDGAEEVPAGGGSRCPASSDAGEASAAMACVLRTAYEDTVRALVSSIEARERETRNHSVRVMEYTVRLAQEMELPEEDIGQIRWGALLHDIGKIGVPDHILFKPGLLNQDEHAVMRRHPVTGFRIVSEISHLDRASRIVLTHHERHGGAGYPNGLRGGEIPLGARIFAVCDTLDAITSARPYRMARPLEEAFAEITLLRGEQFDPEVVDAFARVPLAAWAEIRRRTMPPDNQTTPLDAPSVPLF